MNDSDYVDICKVMEHSSSLKIKLQYKRADGVIYTIYASYPYFDESERTIMEDLTDLFKVSCCLDFGNDVFNAYHIIQSCPITWNRKKHVVNTFTTIAEQQYGCRIRVIYKDPNRNILIRLLSSILNRFGLSIV